MESPAPSKAGPAAVEQQESCPRCQRAISPLVPISTSMRVSGLEQMPLASNAVVMSAPTKADIQRGRYTCAWGQGRPSSPAASVSPNRREAANGAWERQSGSVCVSRYSIAVFPVMTSASTASAEICAEAAISNTSARTPARTEAASASPLPCSAASMREMTSAPQPACGFGALAWASSVPSGPYRQDASVVVPISTAAPQTEKIGSCTKSGISPAKRIWLAAAPSSVTVQSPSTRAQQARRTPREISCGERGSRSASERALSAPWATTRHLPQRPYPAQGISSAWCGRMTLLSSAPICASRCVPLTLTFAKAFPPTVDCRPPALMPRRTAARRNKLRCSAR